MGGLTSDVWYTLLYLTPAERRRLNRRRRVVWLAPLLRSGVGKSAALRLLVRQDRWKAGLEAHGRTPPLREQILWLSHESGVPLDPEPIEQGVDDALGRTQIRPVPGAIAFLRDLADHGTPTAIVSNVLNETGTAARTLLENLDLLRWFRVAVLSCEQPWSKPRPEPFLLAARFLGVRPSALVHIGDLLYDVRGARRAGLKPVLFTGYRDWNRYLPGAPARSLPPRTAVAATWKEFQTRWTFRPGSPRAATDT